MTTNFPMDSHFMQRTDSEATDESPFGSGLTTPVDEDIQPFAGLHERLIAEFDLDLQETPRPDRYQKFDTVDTPAKTRSLSKVVTKAKKFVRGLVQGSKTNIFEDQRVVPTLILPMDSVEINTAEEPSSAIIAQETPCSAHTDVFLSNAFSSTVASSKEMPADMLDTTDDMETVPSDQHLEDSIALTSPDSTHSIPLRSDHEGLLIQHARSMSTTIVKSLDEKAIENITIENNESVLADSTEYLFDEALALKFPDFSPNAVPSALLKILLFLPWCVLVGATILLSPRHLEYVAFFPGYIASPQGIRRFAHWADVAIAHVMIFFAFIVCIGTQHLPLGVALAVLTVGQSIVAWHNFSFDSEIPVGDDDRQSLYLVAVTFGCSKPFMITESAKGYFVGRERDDIAANDDSDTE
ncbi:uncharacterized protein EV420DRAFT_1561310 [Desarmillaria tabescens]|uniref:Uncharacterized protein n=1 Tax=Armillaria tabescens TaxID=1929756 RepID=A0AA39K0K4_ARMTA|nr:uncharacterized protein EV420DRAFT_1561310 [Desarmillaria tabescens]KAK0451181.1 hypothetical protein EV420DRAFT_1561310 [Desarmillaria tabescens]